MEKLTAGIVDETVSVRGFGSFRSAFSTKVKLFLRRKTRYFSYNPHKQDLPVISGVHGKRHTIYSRRHRDRFLSPPSHPVGWLAVSI